MNRVLDILKSYWPDLVLVIVGILLGCYAAFGCYWAGRLGGGMNMGSALLWAAALLGVLAACLAMIVRVFWCGIRPFKAAMARALAALLILLFPFAFLRPGAAAFLDGFSDAVWSRTDPAKVQEWAEGVLARHARKELKLAPQPWHTQYGGPQLAAEEIPDFIRHLWRVPPDYVAIQTFGADKGECVAISWYLHGIVAGPADFQPALRAFRLQRVRPGVHVYILER
ncbi:MAG: hypothetical protein NTW87_33255 [Planctomycetota bacterium]|nr:hypothetical protein [Planctomycetota bacterium]